jgi:hypothetical protein
MKIRSEKHLRESGWVKDEHGTWIGPGQAGIRVARYDANGKKRVNIDEEGCGRVDNRVNLEEAQRTELGGHTEELPSGWVKVPRLPDTGEQVSAFIRAGLSTKEAELAANPSKLFRGR